MAGGLVREARGEMLTPLGLSQVMAARRGAAAVPLSKRAIAAGLKAQRREEAVLAAQRPVPSTSLGTGLAHGAFGNFLRTGSLDTLGTGRS